MEKLTPERNASGEESLRHSDNQLENFKSLARRLLKVRKEELELEDEKNSKNPPDAEAVEE
jgi:hypothetical protein